ncbi:NAD+-dependent alcohol dehydrogenase [Bifidobacterium eulemuris]|uniref:NAD+-dependent alcohol dehydrogenase n=1 Tax=Bifidobacterium eulemuris TaxID=1765219 RepID=A0A261FY37_9BIFI|nr:NAD+-dependent alcohol dehydrogenase [Bifidobacterium eulemuris]
MPFSADGHLPHGRCGSKLRGQFPLACGLGSPASRQVWIETNNVGQFGLLSARHLPHGRCGSKHGVAAALAVRHGHLPHGRCGSKRVGQVAALDGRCHLPHGRCGSKLKNIRREHHGRESPASRQVWIETIARPNEFGRNRSPASRQVWIETLLFCAEVRRSCHLPHGRCGSKLPGHLLGPVHVGSPASRQVWIETSLIQRPRLRCRCHLPHGRCGSKPTDGAAVAAVSGHLPHGRCGSKPP